MKQHHYVTAYGSTCGKTALCRAASGMQAVTRERCRANERWARCSQTYHTVLLSDYWPRDKALTCERWVFTSACTFTLSVMGLTPLPKMICFRADMPARMSSVPERYASPRPTLHVTPDWLVSCKDVLQPPVGMCSQVMTAHHGSVPPLQFRCALTISIPPACSSSWFAGSLPAMLLRCVVLALGAQTSSELWRSIQAARSQY